MNTVRWFYSRSRARGAFKKPLDPRLAGYFYTGPTVIFGHSPPKKKKK